LKRKAPYHPELNAKQNQAVTSDGKRLLVLAGAGSGKTKTLLSKLNYLIEEKGVNPGNILAVTFTRNAANEMTDRLIIQADPSDHFAIILADKQISQEEKNSERRVWKRKYPWIDRLTLSTFHSLCYQILRTDGVNEFDNQFKILTDTKRPDEDELSKYTAQETIFAVFHKLLLQACAENDYLLKLKRYILDYYVDKVHRNTGFVYPDHTQSKIYTSLNGTRVRSKSEQFIADWFYRHSIRYVYEPMTNIRDFDFHPDFYLPDADLFLEHVSNKSFPTHNKEKQFEKANLIIVKTTEEMTRDSALFGQELERIVKNRLPAGYFKNIDLSFQEEFKFYHENVKDFLIQVMRVTDMIKVENSETSDISGLAAKDQHERVRCFYELAIPLIEAYTAYCIDKSYLDFNDMLIRAISLFRNHPDIATKYRKKYTHILVDEFQDVNTLQVELLKMLLTDEAQLFCVGDDWQSIYGFRGSNISYIVDFEHHFKNSEIIKLDTNYRSTQSIVGASNEVIKNNKYQIEKNLIASKKSEHKIVVYAGNNEAENLDFCEHEIRDLMDNGYSGEDILFLYRRSKMAHPYFEHFKKAGIRVQFKTIHSAKGLESKVVFIVGLTEGPGGFPDIWLEDRIFQVIKKANVDLLLEEERRLFYVALTRARDKLFLITEKGCESSFLKEIPAIFTVKTSLHSRRSSSKSPLCSKCFSQLESLWKVCPFCGEVVSDEKA